MQIKRFIEPDMRKAMRKVRKELGADAVILETTPVSGGIEITAAIDYDPAAYELARMRPASSDTVAGAVSGFAQTDSTQNTELAGMRDEMKSMRALLQSQISRMLWDERSRRTPELTRVMRNLTGLGITPDIIVNLTSDMVDDAPAGSSWTASLRKLVDDIPVCDHDPILDGGIFAVIGPTGAGKTTSIAKLAARYALGRSASEIALVTTDTFRIGARAQLQTFGEILGTPVHQASDTDSLNDTLHSLSEKRLILIDTAGMGQHDIRLTRELSVIGNTEQKVQPLLTLPANLQTTSLQNIVETFALAKPVACILTKTDEATSLGGIFSVLLRSGLPLAYIANGQRVPDDFHLANARRTWLIKAAVEMMRRQDIPITDDFMAQSFAEAGLNEYS